MNFKTQKFHKNGLLVFAFLSTLLPVGMRGQIMMSEMNDQGYKEVLYCDSKRALYKQEPVTTTEAFKHASRDEQEAMLEEYFKANKVKALGWLAGKEAVRFSAISAGSMYFFMRLFMAQNNQNIGAAMNAARALENGVFTMFGGLIFSVGNFVQNKIRFIWSLLADGILPYLQTASTKTLIDKGFCPELLSYFGLSLDDGGMLPLEELEIRYVRNKPWLDVELQKKIEDIFIEFYCNEENKQALTNGKQSAALTTYVIKTAFDLPTQIKPIAYDEAIHTQPFLGYSQAIQDVIKLFCTFHDQSQYLDKPHRYPFYFYGAPGVGKTHAVELIAKTLGVPFASITLGNSLSHLIGDSGHPGSLLQAITSAKLHGKGAKNMILLIDEADKIINFDKESSASPQLEAIRAFLLKFFGDKQEKTFDSPYLGIEIDISHVGIILAGNEPVEYDALEDRFTSVEFPALTTEQKQHIVEVSLLDKALENFEKTNSNQRFTLSKSDLTQADYDAIKKIVQEDTNSGLRTIEKNLDGYFTMLSSCKANHKDGVAQCVQKLTESIAKVTGMKKSKRHIQNTQEPSAALQQERGERSEK